MEPSENPEIKSPETTRNGTKQPFYITISMTIVICILVGLSFCGLAFISLGLRAPDAIPISLFYLGTFLIFVLSSLIGIILASAVRRYIKSSLMNPEQKKISAWFFSSLLLLAFLGSGFLIYFKTQMVYFDISWIKYTVIIIISLPLWAALLISISVTNSMLKARVNAFRKISLFVATVACLVAVTLFWIMPWVTTIRSKANYASKEPAYTGDSANLEKTVIVPTLNSPMPEHKNVIWCSSFQLAWNEMKDSVIKEPIRLTGAETLTERLNNAQQTKADLDEQSYYVASGLIADGIIEKIKKEMEQRFPGVTLLSFDRIKDQLDAIMAYAYMNANVKFKYPYRQGRYEFTFTDSQGNKTNVEYFGAWEGWRLIYKNIGKQIQILYAYSDPNTDPHGFQLHEFAVDLCKYSEPYQIVVAVTDKKETLQGTLDYLTDKITEYQETDPNGEFDEMDEITLPEMFWEIDHHFEELIGKTLANENFRGWPVIEALQKITFRLDKSGAFLESQSVLAVCGIPRSFIFDKPFLIYMKKRGAEHPCLVMWVDNAELLTKK